MTRLRGLGLAVALLGLAPIQPGRHTLRVGFLVDDRETRSAPQQQEIDAAWRFLSQSPGFEAERLPLSSLERTVKRFDVFFWHETRPSAPLPPSTAIALARRVEEGAGLLLSLRAVRSLVDLGLEDRAPNGDFEGAREWEPDAMFGFESQGGHPLLADFFGGVYTWRPSSGEVYWRSDYVGDLWPKGRVIAVEKAHIALEPRRRIAWEHRLGKGRILALSSFLYFGKPAHRFRPHLERFTRGALQWVAQPRAEAETFWTPRGTGAFVEDKSLDRAPASLRGPFPSMGQPVLTASGEDAATADPWDLSGLRLLACGTRSGRTTEVWAFPVRVLKDLEWGVKRPGDDSVRWLSRPESFRVSPHAVEWEFLAGEDVRVRERAWVDRDQPALYFRFEIASSAPISLQARFRPELTSEWPRLEGDLGALRLYRDPDSGWIGWQSEAGERSALLALGKPGRAWLGDVEAFYGTLPSPGAPGSRGELREPLAVAEMDWHPGDPPLFAAVSGETLSFDPDASFARASAHTNDLLKAATVVQTDDTSWNEGYLWAVAMLDRFEVESPGVGRGLMAGFEASRPGWFRARPGYAWYFGRDALWCALALDALGRFDTVENALDLLTKHQEFTGKILHELTPTASVHYDAADSTPLYLIALAHHLRWSGRVDFVRSRRDSAAKALAFLRSTDTDGDGLIENTEVGHGWIEGGKLYGGHTTFYLAGLWAEALRAASEIFDALGDSGEAERARRESVRVRAILERDFWNPAEGGYFYSKLRDGRFLSAPTILPAVPMGFGTLDPSRGATYLDTLASSDITADWGARILARSHPAYNPVGYHEGSVWPLFSGWAAIAEYAYHRPQSGFLHIAQTLANCRDFNLGAIEEVLHGDFYRPRGITSHQAWSESLPVQATLEGMLGARPDARKRTLRLAPHFPPSWQTVRVGPLHVGTGTVSLSMTGGTFHLDARGLDRLILSPAFPAGSRVRAVRRDGRLVDFLTAETEDVHVDVDLRLSSGATTVAFDVERAPTLEIPLPVLERDQPSRGLRLIHERFRPGRLEVELEGREGARYEVTGWDVPAGAHWQGAEPVATEGRKTRAWVAIPGTADRYRKHQLAIAWP